MQLFITISSSFGCLASSRYTEHLWSAWSLICLIFDLPRQNSRKNYLNIPQQLCFLPAKSWFRRVTGQAAEWSSFILILRAPLVSLVYTFPQLQGISYTTLCGDGAIHREGHCCEGIQSWRLFWCCTPYTYSPISRLFNSWNLPILLILSMPWRIL